MKNLVCVVCPRGCRLTVNETPEGLTVEGNSCPRGEKYAKQEVVCPMRMLATTVKLENAKIHRCPVRTSGQIPRELMMKVTCEAAHITLTAPVRAGQVVIQNVCDTGEDLIVTRNIGLTN